MALMVTAGGAAAAGTSACGGNSRGDEDPAGIGVVRSVVDGDTIDVRIDGRHDRVRLIGIDTPEVAAPDHPAECYGPEASRYSAGLLVAGMKVRLVRDVVGRDDYGRLLAYVFRVEDNLFVNEHIIAAGFARPLNIEPNSAYHRRFVEAAAAAKRSSLGLWGGCSS